MPLQNPLATSKVWTLSPWEPAKDLLSLADAVNPTSLASLALSPAGLGGKLIPWMNGRWAHSKKVKHFSLFVNSQ